ncbi:MAG TPA: hypothetical protein VH796_03475 [Nitrososphaeraceae archaeon]|jgi:hypothetical protein
MSLSSSSIPDHDSWIVTMWHFGTDSSSEYTGVRLGYLFSERIYRVSENKYGLRIIMMAKVQHFHLVYRL